MALSVLSHPGIDPNLRIRSERMRDEHQSGLNAQQIEAAEILAGEKTAEEWAEEFLNSTKKHLSIDLPQKDRS